MERRYRIPVLHCDTIHDHYPFRDSASAPWPRSRITWKRHPELEIILDLHRDATPGLEHRVMIRNRPAAKIVLVVEPTARPSPSGTGKNHQFAMELVTAINRVYPDLAHRVILADAHNQHVHEKAILVEIGNEKSTLEESLYSAELFAEILASYLDPAATLQSFSL